MTGAAGEDRLWWLPRLPEDKFLVIRKKALPRHPNLVYEIGYDDVLRACRTASTLFPTVASDWPVPRVVDRAGTLCSVVGRTQSVGAPFILSRGR